MTNEIDPDEYIEEFLSVGPKNYAYRTVNARTLKGITLCKVWGINLNYAATQLIKFDSTRDLILGADSVDVCIQKKIKSKTLNCDDICANGGRDGVVALGYRVQSVLL